MRRMHWLGIVAVVAGCASSGGGLFPEAGDANAAIANADRLIAEAVTAGADSLAAQPLATARENVAAAKAMLNDGKKDRAALEARQAAADATFAKEEAKRIMAERQRAEAVAALNQLPPGGAR